MLLVKQALVLGFLSRRIARPISRHKRQKRCLEIPLTGGEMKAKKDTIFILVSPEDTDLGQKFAEDSTFSVGDTAEDLFQTMKSDYGAETLDEHQIWEIKLVSKKRIKVQKPVKPAIKMVEEK
jgi:hypothetical protein